MSTVETPAAPPTRRPAPDQTFRDQLGTADKVGRRLWVFPKRPSGPFYRWRTWVSWLQLGLLFGGPYIMIGGHPLLMLNVIDRKFVILGQVFWPQDTYLFMVGMLCFFVFIFLFTAVYGRVFCGWLCPQTVFLEMLFRKVEYWIDGDATEQRALAAAPWTEGKILRRVVKHTLFFGLAFLIGNTLLAYIIGKDALWAIITDDPRRHLGGLATMLLFTGAFYWIYAYFREQICCFVCPYGRLQSVLLDEHSLTVAYDYKRGESRERFLKGDTIETRRAREVGNCINCGLCQKVCPTGIDIRNGTQLECINCAACIDACNFMMAKVGLPGNLIRYASQRGIERGERFRWTPRTVGYTAALVALLAVMGVLLATRSDLAVTVLRTPGQLFQMDGEGRVVNLYGVEVVNKSFHDRDVTFKLESHQGVVQVAGQTLQAGAEQVTKTALTVHIPRGQLRPFGNPIVIGVYRDGECIQRIKTSFVAPG
jgi:cytochrome c oxidase accessory protein FixG